MAIIAKTQEELQDMVNRLVDTGSKYGMEINIEPIASQCVIKSYCNVKVVPLQIRIKDLGTGNQSRGY